MSLLGGANKDMSFFGVHRMLLPALGHIGLGPGLLLSFSDQNKDGSTKHGRIRLAVNSWPSAYTDGAHQYILACCGNALTQQLSCHTQFVRQLHPRTNSIFHFAGMGEGFLGKRFPISLCRLQLQTRNLKQHLKEANPCPRETSWVSSKSGGFGKCVSERQEEERMFAFGTHAPNGLNSPESHTVFKLRFPSLHNCERMAVGTRVKAWNRVMINTDQ